MSKVSPNGGSSQKEEGWQHCQDPPFPLPSTLRSTTCGKQEDWYRGDEELTFISSGWSITWQSTPWREKIEISNPAQPHSSWASGLWQDRCLQVCHSREWTQPIVAENVKTRCQPGWSPYGVQAGEMSSRLLIAWKNNMYKETSFAVLPWTLASSCFALSKICTK